MQIPLQAWRSTTGLAVIGLFWLATVILGFAILGREEFTAVRSAPSAASFPSESAIPLASDKPTLLLFLHPQCPCSRASLHELDQVLAETQGRLAVTLIFTLPSGVPAGWERGALWDAATTMPGVRVICDPDGVETRRFDVNGSGHTLLYSPTGNLLFSGGITASRGHEGDNPGQSAILSLLLTGHAPVNRTPVFGCSLL